MGANSSLSTGETQVYDRLVLSHFIDKKMETPRTTSSELSHSEIKLELEARLAGLREQHWISFSWQENLSGEKRWGRGCSKYSVAPLFWGFILEKKLKGLNVSANR